MMCAWVNTQYRSTASKAVATTTNDLTFFLRSWLFIQRYTSLPEFFMLLPAVILLASYILSLSTGVFLLLTACQILTYRALQHSAYCLLRNLLLAPTGNLPDFMSLSIRKSLKNPKLCSLIRNSIIYSRSPVSFPAVLRAHLYVYRLHP